MGKSKRESSSTLQCFRVRSIEERGHWRSGRHWSSTWQELCGDDVTDAMLNDPRLRVELIEDVVQGVIDEV